LQRSKNFLSIVFFYLIYSATAYSQFQNNSSYNWNGEWMAEGTIFRVRLEVEGSRLIVHQLESMGFDWTNEIGHLEGNIATISVEYAGVKGIIQAEFFDDTTASVSAASCIPDFMVICLLAKDQKAIFKKIVK
tara:strand:- start:476 stop:874 length:399 start_codon:yes stop_codon:yes gene_type:complete